MRKRVLLIAIVGITTLAADQVTKRMAHGSLRHQAPVNVIDGYLALEYHENPGMAFGIGRNWPGGRYILVVIGLGVLVIVWRMVRHVQHRQRAADVAFAMIAGGAIGNLVDRIYLGRVIDFVVMHWQRKYQWPAYNVADAALVAGVILLILVLGKKQQTEASARHAGRHARPSKKSRA